MVIKKVNQYKTNTVNYMNAKNPKKFLYKKLYKQSHRTILKKAILTILISLDARHNLPFRMSMMQNDLTKHISRTLHHVYTLYFHTSFVHFYPKYWLCLYCTFLLLLTMISDITKRVIKSVDTRPQTTGRYYYYK